MRFDIFITSDWHQKRVKLIENGVAYLIFDRSLFICNTRTDQAKRKIKFQNEIIYSYRNKGCL